MQRIRHLAARTANEGRGSYRFLSQLQRLLHCPPCQGVGTQQRDYRGTLSVICARLLCQRLIKPLRYRLPQHFHPFSIEMFEIARAMEDLAALALRMGRTQIKEAKSRRSQLDRTGAPWRDGPSRNSETWR